MQVKMIGWAVGLTTGILVSGMATAQTMGASCAPRETVVQRLAESYGETRHGIGIGSNNQVMEVFASRETGTWTITVTMPNGMTCLMASGQAFETLAEALPAEGQKI